METTKTIVLHTDNLDVELIRLLSTAYVVIVEQDEAGNYIITLNQQ